MRTLHDASSARMRRWTSAAAGPCLGKVSARSRAARGSESRTVSGLQRAQEPGLHHVLEHRDRRRGRTLLRSGCCNGAERGLHHSSRGHQPPRGCARSHWRRCNSQRKGESTRNMFVSVAEQLQRCMQDFATCRAAGRAAMSMRARSFINVELLLVRSAVRRSRPGCALRRRPTSRPLWLRTSTEDAHCERGLRNVTLPRPECSRISSRVAHTPFDHRITSGHVRPRRTPPKTQQRHFKRERAP